MKLLYGTGNPAKLNLMRKALENTGLEIIGLNDLNELIPDVPEDGKTPLENASQKAHAYYNAFRMPVFSCDSGNTKVKNYVILVFQHTTTYNSGGIFFK